MKAGQRFLVLLLSATLCTGVAASAARARTVGDATFPDTVTENGQTLVLNGIGTRVFALIVDGYASALYLPRPARSIEDVLAQPGPKLLVTRFLHAASANQIRNEYKAVFDRYCATNRCGAASRITFGRILASVQAVKRGDTASCLIDDGDLTLDGNGVVLVRAHDPDYARAMLAALLGAASPTAGYRNGLLGGN